MVESDVGFFVVVTAGLAAIFFYALGFAHGRLAEITERRRLKHSIPPQETTHEG